MSIGHNTATAEARGLTRRRSRQLRLPLRSRRPNDSRQSPAAAIGDEAQRIAGRQRARASSMPAGAPEPPATASMFVPGPCYRMLQLLPNPAAVGPMWRRP